MDSPPVASNGDPHAGHPRPHAGFDPELHHTRARYNAPESGTTIVWYLNSQAVAADNNLLTIPASAVQRNQQWYVSSPRTMDTSRGAGASNTVAIEIRRRPRSMWSSPPPSRARGHARAHLHVLGCLRLFGVGTTISSTRSDRPAEPRKPAQRPPSRSRRVTSGRRPSRRARGRRRGRRRLRHGHGAGHTSRPRTATQHRGTARMLLTPPRGRSLATDVDNDPLTFDCAVGTKDFGPGPAYTARFPVGTTIVSCSVSDGTSTVDGDLPGRHRECLPSSRSPEPERSNPAPVSAHRHRPGSPRDDPSPTQWSDVSSPVPIALSGADNTVRRLHAVRGRRLCPGVHRLERLGAGVRPDDGDGDAACTACEPRSRTSDDGRRGERSPSTAPQRSIRTAEPSPTSGQSRRAWCSSAARPAPW